MLNKKILEEMYFSKENKEICKELGISNFTLVSYVKKFGITPKGKGHAFKTYNKGRTKIKLVFDDE